MEKYVRSEASDLLLLRWWGALMESGELAQTFGIGAKALSKFLEHFQPPKLFLYDADASGISFCFLLEPFLSGAACTLWVRPDKRQSPSHYKLVRQCYETALVEFGVIIGITRKEMVVEHEKWGYLCIGTVPHLLNEEDGYIVHLTPAAYEAARGARGAA